MSALNISIDSKDEVPSVFSDSAIRKIGFNPETNSRYVEPERKNPGQAGAKFTGITKLPISGLRAKDIIELTDEEE